MQLKILPLELQKYLSGRLSTLQEDCVADGTQTEGPRPHIFSVLWGSTIFLEMADSTKGDNVRNWLLSPYSLPHNTPSPLSFLAVRHSDRRPTVGLSPPEDQWIFTPLAPVNRPSSSTGQVSLVGVRCHWVGVGYCWIWVGLIQLHVGGGSKVSSPSRGQVRLVSVHGGGAQWAPFLVGTLPFGSKGGDRRGEGSDGPTPSFAQTAWN